MMQVALFCHHYYSIIKALSRPRHPPTPPLAAHLIHLPLDVSALRVYDLVEVEGVRGKQRQRAPHHPKVDPSLWPGAAGGLLAE